LGYHVKLFDKLICGCSKFYIVFLNVASPCIKKWSAMSGYLFLAITHG